MLYVICYIVSTSTVLLVYFYSIHKLGLFPTTGVHSAQYGVCYMVYYIAGPGDVAIALVVLIKASVRVESQQLTKPAKTASNQIEKEQYTHLKYSILLLVVALFNATDFC